MVQDPKTRRGIDEQVLQKRYPKTWAYLKRFEAVLRERSGFRRYFTRKDRNGRMVETGPFYSMFNVGDYTFAPWKVVWRYVASDFIVAVVGPASDEKPVVPNEKLMLVPVEDDNEAFYLCGVLNSSPIRFAVQSFFVQTQIAPHVLQKLCIPRYEPNTDHQNRIAHLSRRAHELAPAAYNGDKAARAELRRVEEEIDRAAAQLWGLTEEELAEIRRSLEELRGSAMKRTENPFHVLRPALGVLVSEAQVLPATGQAMEDQAIPDLEEVYDQRTGGAGRFRPSWKRPTDGFTAKWSSYPVPSNTSSAISWTVRYARTSSAR